MLLVDCVCFSSLALVWSRGMSSVIATCPQSSVACITALALHTHAAASISAPAAPHTTQAAPVAVVWNTAGPVALPSQYSSPKLRMLNRLLAVTCYAVDVEPVVIAWCDVQRLCKADISTGSCLPTS